MCYCALSFIGSVTKTVHTTQREASDKKIVKQICYLHLKR